MIWISMWDFSFCQMRLREGFCFASYVGWRSQSLKTPSRMKVFDHCHRLLPLWFSQQPTCHQCYYKNMGTLLNSISQVRQILATTLVIQPFKCFKCLKWDKSGLTKWASLICREPRCWVILCKWKAGQVAWVLSRMECDGTIWGQNSSPKWDMALSTRHGH